MKTVTESGFSDSAVWRLTELVFRKLLSLIVSTFLARFLDPNAYGLVSLTTIFITFSDIFLLNGFNVALIRKENIEEIDYSTVMSLGLLFSLIIYIVLFISAPFVAQFYDSPDLCNVLRVIMLVLFFQSVSSVISVKATREFKFKEMSIISVITSVVSGLLGIFLAYNGCGVWSLVLQQLSLNFLGMISLAMVFRWKISFKISIETAKKMLRFTGGVIEASFLDFLGNNLSGLIIGRTYSSVELGYYNRGNAYPETIGLNVFNAINSVLLPTLASRQNDISALKRVVRKVISITEYILIPMMVGLAAVSDNFVSVLLTDKWLPCIPVMICSCIYYLLNPIRAIGSSVFYAIGDSKKTVRVEIVRSIMLIMNMLITLVLFRQSIYVLSVASVVIALIVAILTINQLNKSIGYSLGDLFEDIWKTVTMSVVMAIVVRLIGLLSFSKPVVFLLQVVCGIAIYLFLSLITKNNECAKILKYIQSKVVLRQNAKE